METQAKEASRCGVADTKRPMLEMLREALNHHDRIPHQTNSAPLTAWVKHIVANYKKLPAMLFFTPAVVPASSSVFQPNSITRALEATPYLAREQRAILDHLEANLKVRVRVSGTISRPASR